MTVLLDFDSLIDELVNELGHLVYFILVTSENGVVMKSYINEEEFNKASIALNVSQLYELAEDLTQEVGLQEPDFNITHSSNYYVISIKVLERIIILLTQDQVEISHIFDIINKSLSPK